MGLQPKEEVTCDDCRNKPSAERKIIVNVGRETPSSSFSPLFLPSLPIESCAFGPPPLPRVTAASGLSCSSDPFGTHPHKAQGWLCAGSPPAGPESGRTTAASQLPSAWGTESPGATPRACSTLSNQSNNLQMKSSNVPSRQREIPKPCL